MKFKNNFLICVVMFCFIALGCGSTSKSGTNELWEQVILRSTAQKEAGIIGGEGMQQIFGIAFAPSNPEIVYLVSNTSQVWKSINSGNSWQMKHSGFLSYGGISVSVDPNNEDIVFVAGSLDKSSLSSSADGIYRTTDGGENWELVKSTPFYGGREGQHFVFGPKSSDGLRTKIIYAGTHQEGLLVSKDGGDNWEMLGFKDERILDIKLDPTTSSVLYLLTVKGLFKVTIKDSVISQIEELGEDLQGLFKTFALNLQNPLIIYVAMGKEGIYRSIDGGKDFYKLENGLPAELNYIHIAISPVNADFLYVSVEKYEGLNPFWSHDGGVTWSAPTTIDEGGLSLAGEHRYFSGPIEPHPEEPNIALFASNGKARILKTVNGGTSWFYSGNGYTGGRKGVGKSSQAFHADPMKMIFFLLDHGPILTEDGEATFRFLMVPHIGGQTTPVGAVSPDPEENLIITAVGGVESQVLVVSDDGGETWRIIEGTDDNYRFIAFHRQKPNLIYAQSWKSEDGGNVWEQLSYKVYAMFKGNSDIVYTVDNFSDEKSIIKRSNDQGKTWESPYLYLPVKAEAVNEIDVDLGDPDRIYVASNNGFYIYDDESRKWQKKDEKSGLSKDRFGMISFKCLAIDPEHPEIIYAGRWAPRKGHSNGIFRSTDFGETWRNITYNLGPEITVWSISVSPHDGTVYLGSSHGTWKLPPPY